MSENSYNLCATERIYRDDTYVSFYYQSNQKNEKKFCPIEVNGERIRLNIETGEMTRYNKNDYEQISSCSVRRTRILMNMLLKMNDFDWFVTLTFDNEKIDRTDDEQVYQCYKKYINNIHKQYPQCTYMCFPERHEDYCIHFHLMMGNITAKQLGLVNSGKVCCHWAWRKKCICSKQFFERTKQYYVLTDTDGLIVYNVTKFYSGLTTATIIASRERCNTYVKKYVDKALGSTGMFKKRFFYSSNLQMPEIFKRCLAVKSCPSDIEASSIIQNDELFKSAESPYVSRYNTLSFWVNNEKKENIKRGFKPHTQIKFNDIRS